MSLIIDTEYQREIRATEDQLNRKWTERALEAIARWLPSPGLLLVRKADSRLHRLINVVLSPLTRGRYMTGYTTVLGNVVALPVGTDPTCLTPEEQDTLWHEGQHARDSAGWRRLPFSIAYLFPQILAVPLLLGAVWGGWQWAVAGLVALLPWPAPFRFWLELRAYCLQIAFASCGRSYDTEWIAQNLTSGAYYWPLPNILGGRRFARWLIARQVARIERAEPTSYEADAMSFALHREADTTGRVKDRSFFELL